MSEQPKMPIFDAQKYKLHARSVIGADGRRRTEKRPIVKSIRMVDPQGHVCWMPLYTGPSQMSEADPYRQSITSAKEQAGWVTYGECPKNSNRTVKRNLPEATRDGAPCRLGVKGGQVSDADPCKCIVDLVAERGKENARAMKALEGAGKTLEQAAHEVQVQILEETRKQNAALSAKANSGKDGK